MQAWRRALWTVMGSAALALAPACGSADDAPASEGPAAPPLAESPPTPPGAKPAEDPVKKELPWEVVSEQGETYLSNVFYAEATENEQIMPTAIDGRYQIDRMIYPTLGNPNLYVKGDPKDTFMVVLRLEDAAVAHLKPESHAVPGSALEQIDFTESLVDTFAFLLVPRTARNGATEATAPVPSGQGTEVIRIKPTRVLSRPNDQDMPAALQARRTYRFVFDQAAMKDVPAGLYDVRYELRKDNKLFSIEGAPQPSPTYEYQWNALRVFDKPTDEYTVVNVTDTQVSVGDFYNNKTRDKLEELVYYLNTSRDANVRNAAFITFNGDLHNGGSPGSLRQRTVANTYNDEAKAILEQLKYLPFPIFLVAGNHDGYVSTGQVPGAVQTIDNGLGDDLEAAIMDANPKAWPGYKWLDFKAYLDKTNKPGLIGGIHHDIYQGSFVRRRASTFRDGWIEVPRKDRNMILYDGFYQWQRTYGPLTSSWKFGKNRYVALNSFELRQHRRSGWGMYTVNYGGGMSEVQIAWLDRELDRSKALGEDVVLLAHHDPRGGHKATDWGYYFEQLEYKGVQQSAVNYLLGKVFNPIVCKLPSWATSQSEGQSESCLHDGLQEWMRPDPELDCRTEERLPNGKCDPAIFDGTKGAAKGHYFSAIELVRRINASREARTFLLGHTHFNSMETLQAGDEVVPRAMPNGNPTMFASLEVQNPVRGYSAQGSGGDYDPAMVGKDGIIQKNAVFGREYSQAVTEEASKLGGGAGRELAILRLTCASDLTGQTYQGKAMMGFSVLKVKKVDDQRKLATPQINSVVYYINEGGQRFDDVKEVPIPRTTRLGPRDAENPLRPLFSGGL